VVPDEESLTSGGGEKMKGIEGEMRKQCLLQRKIKGIMPVALSMDPFFIFCSDGSFFLMHQSLHILLKDTEVELIRWKWF